MSEDDRLPGESEVDHRYRLRVRREAEEDSKRKEALAKYLPTTELIAKSRVLSWVRPATSRTVRSRSPW